MINIILAFIAIALIIDASLLGFLKISQNLRRNHSKQRILNPSIKSKMLEEISMMNKKIKEYEANYINRQKYNELAKKYSILLNSHRELGNKNNALRQRIEKLKQKIY